MSEEFKVEKVNEVDGFKITQTKQDILNATRIQQVYISIQQTIKNMQEQMKQQQEVVNRWPEQKSFLENEITGLKTRLSKIEPFIAEINLKVKQEAEKNKRLKETNKPEVKEDGKTPNTS